MTGLPKPLGQAQIALLDGGCQCAAERLNHALLSIVTMLRMHGSLTHTYATARSLLSSNV